MKQTFFNGLDKLTKLKDNFLNQMEFENPETSKYQKIIDNLLNLNDSTKNETISNKYFDLSSENYPNNGIFFLALVSFHQKSGSVIEKTYPSKEEILKNENIFNLLKNNNNIDNNEILNDIFNQLTIYCLSDGIHLVNSDNIIFFIQNYSKILFCISSYRQIRTQNKKIIDDFQENTRDCIQKSLCIVTLNPYFSFFNDNLNKTIDVFMSQENLNEKNVIENLYNNIIYEENLHILTYEDYFIKFFNYRKIIYFLKEDLFTIFKLILLEKKIIVYSQIPSNCSSFILSLLSLFPGFLYFNKKFPENEKKFSLLLNSQKFYNRNGFPLRFINDKNLLYPIFSLFDMDSITNKNKCESFIIGSSNALVLNNNLNANCIINLDEKTITYNYDNLSYNIFSLTENEKNLYKTIFNILDTDIKIEKESNKKKQTENKFDFSAFNKLFSFNKRELEGEWFVFNYLSNKFDEGTLNLNLKSYLYEIIIKENNFIVPKIHDYFNSLIYDISYAINEINKKEDLNDKFELIFPNLYKNKQEEKKLIENENELPSLEILISDPNIYKINKCLKNFNLHFIGNYLKTNNFKYWFNNHNNILFNLSNCNDNIIENLFVIYENGDDYNGPIQYGKKNGIGVYNYLRKNLKYKGNFLNDKKNGKGILESSNNNKYYYEGNFLNDKITGEGILITDDERYEGYFKDGLFDGKGTLVDGKGNYYIGEFKNGLKHGNGNFKKINGEIEEGIFENNFYKGDVNNKNIEKN